MRGQFIRKAMLELDVLPVHVAQSGKAFEQRSEIGVFLLCAACVPQIANPGDSSDLLRTSDGCRRRHCSADTCDERTTLHRTSCLRVFQPYSVPLLAAPISAGG